jgi:hypothetical protein
MARGAANAESTADRAVYVREAANAGEWQVFPAPRQWGALQNSEVVRVPGTRSEDLCIVVRADIWRVFVEHSLWIEALTIHQWALFTESVAQGGGCHVDRGDAYTLLTDRPGNRRPITWERNRVDLLLLEGNVFTCPWTGAAWIARARAIKGRSALVATRVWRSSGGGAASGRR